MPRRAKLLLAALVLGPLTGPLVLGCARCLAAHRPVMAAIYALGVVEVAIGLPTLAAALMVPV